MTHLRNTILIVVALVATMLYTVASASARSRHPTGQRLRSRDAAAGHPPRDLQRPSPMDGCAYRRRLGRSRGARHRTGTSTAATDVSRAIPQPPETDAAARRI